MVKGLEKQKQICHIFEQIMILIQVVSLFVVFLVSLYWFLELINNHALSFLDSIMNFVKELMKSQFGEELKKGQAGVDGSLFIFIAFVGVVIYISSQIKIFLKFQQASLEKAIVKKKEEETIAFNKQLQSDVKDKIMSYKNVIILVNIHLKSFLRDFYQSHNEAKQVDPRQEEIVLVALYNMLKTIQGCNFSKDGKTLIISSKNFDNVDTILLKIDEALTHLQAQLKARKLTISTNMAIDVFPNGVQLKDVYADLKSLLKLNMPNEILCYGNFCNRYEQVKEPKFEAFLKGTYEITDDENIWSLVKKS